jgi:hypothetical protein
LANGSNLSSFLVLDPPLEIASGADQSWTVGKKTKTKDHLVVLNLQGDRIRRIFTHWAIVYFGQVF